MIKLSHNFAECALNKSQLKNALLLINVLDWQLSKRGKRLEGLGDAVRHARYLEEAQAHN